MPDECSIPFMFDVSEDITLCEDKMNIVANALDGVEDLFQRAKEYLKNQLLHEDGEYYETISYFMEFHRDEIDSETAEELFSTKDYSELSFVEMVNYLKLKRFGSFVDDALNRQAFIMDLSFNPEITDELLVIFFDLEKQIYCVSHES